MHKALCWRALAAAPSVAPSPARQWAPIQPPPGSPGGTAPWERHPDTRCNCALKPPALLVISPPSLLQEALKAFDLALQINPYMSAIAKYREIAKASLEETSKSDPGTSSADSM